MMKSTQRASSPPVPAHPSPTASPTITQASSRRSTPSPSDTRHDISQSSTFHHTSPPRSHPSEPQPKEGDGRLRAGSDRQDGSHTRIVLPPSYKSVLNTRLARALQQARSQCTDSSMPPSAIPPSTTSLSELAHLIRLERYQEQKRSNSRVRLHRYLVSAALSARLLHCGEVSYRTLIDQFRSNDLECVRNFAALYSALHDVRNSCESLRRYAVLEQDIDPKTKSSKIETTTSFATFMHDIPQKIRSELLTFVSTIRTNPDFLATRIVSLSQQELAVLTSFRSQFGPKESVFASGKGGSNAKKFASLSASPTPIKQLLCFQRHDPLSALIYTIFANSSGPDSAEDLRRTDAWATTCARLISEDKPGGEALVRGVLDTFAGMREWPAKANLELFLMNALQDGYFLLEKAESQTTGSGVLAESVVNKVREYAAEEFFDRSVRRLLELIDDEPSAGGMPEGIMEIGSAILKRMGPSKRLRGRAETYILHRWFFSSYLPNALIWPESHGIMVGYHIPIQARDKILREIASRVQRQVLGSIHNIQQAVPIMPEVKTHLDNLLNRLRHPKLNGRPVLQPAKAIASPRETVEVQPFIVVCPSDIITLVNSLFPEQRPAATQPEKSSPRGGLVSTTSSISSMPFRTTSVSTPGDGSSVLSMSASSITSDGTSREPLLEPSDNHNDECDGERQTEERSAMAPVSPTEDYGRRLRMACSEMQRILGPEVSSGTCHPCAERWAVLYVSPDGKSLRTRMRKDSEDDDSSEDDSDDSDSEDEGPMQRFDLESDYHVLKDSVVKLLQEYELPKHLAPESESKAFSNRTTTQRQQRSLRPIRRTEVSLSGDEAAVTKNQPLVKSTLSGQAHIQRTVATSKRQSSSQNLRSHSEGEAEDSHRTKPSDLIVMLETVYRQCQSREKFVDAHQWFTTLEQLRKLSSPSLTRDGYAPLLNYFARGPRDSLAKSFGAIEEFEAWFAWLKQSQDRYETNIDDMMIGFKNLRDKMWYKNAVITSAGYEEAKNVAIALKVMGQPSKTPDGKGNNQQKLRQLPKNNNFLLKTEAQTLDIMAANSEIAGPNKLADDQSEMTSKWLSQYAVENFCKGEERIHRFCLEVDRCVNKLVGDSFLEAPVLWSSELFCRDKDILDSGRQKGDLFLTGVGTLSIANDEEYETHTRSVPKSLDVVQRPSQSSLRSISTSCSQQSFNSSVDNRGLNLLDMQDYFGASSQTLAIDENVTFWSPFQAQAHSPISNGSIRPTTSSSSRGTMMLKNSSAVNEDKRKFLLDLKQTLTGLLLSDLGSAVFGNGSETDSWFSGELGEECIQRKEAEERRRKQKLARKKSMRSMKSSKEQARNKNVDVSKVAAGSMTSNAETNSAAEHSTSSSETPGRSSGLSAAKKAGLLEFPYNVAFRRLLCKFATHPNPFTKLHTLYELELLIVASLSSRIGRQHGRQNTLPTVPQSPTLGSVPELSSREASVQTQQPQNIEDAIANVTKRHHHTLNAHHPPGDGNFRPGARSPTGPPSTDTIIEVLQSLFRDSEIRPRTLFRDLQYIAAFVPAQMLDKTARGKAFWDAGLAALGLKQDVCRYMVEIADDIVAENTERRTTTEEQRQQQRQQQPQQPQQQQQQQRQQHQQQQQQQAATVAVTSAATTTTTIQSSDAPNTNQVPGTTPTEQPVSRWTMADAARMLIITAKEGDAVAERELAIFYLTHPDLLPRTVSPFSKPKEIFKGELLSRDRRREDPARSDPMTMCVAQHWMEQSRKGGDELATKYLRARDDIESIP